MPRIILSPLLALAVVLGACRNEPAGRPARPSGPPGVRITMDALHRAGGIPPRWRFRPPPGDVGAGREAFVELGCHTCHAVQEESFSAATASGPELSGMGAHHPPEYFAEAIINPNAVLVDGPGYIGPDGYSTMPSYPDMTLIQLADLVAYVTSLGGGQAEGAAGQHAHHAIGELALPRLEQPAAPQSDASSFFVQIYELQEGKLREFEEWFRTAGAPGFLAHDGLLSIETYVDNTRAGPALTTVFGFRSDAARERFLVNHEAEGLQTQFDAFIGPHPHHSYRRPPLYKAPSLSAP